MNSFADRQMGVDEHLGQRIRRRRKLLGVTLAALGEACGTTFQQIHKYETGQCSLSATRLWKIAVALETPVAHFFQGLRLDAAQDVPSRSGAERAEVAELARAFAELGPAQRRRLLALVTTLANEPSRDRVAAAERSWDARSSRRRDGSGAAHESPRGVLRAPSEDSIAP